METTFISIHNLEADARILYSSDSIIDILGYTPDDVVNRSAWDFFCPEELPYAQQFHHKKISQDKAAVLAYCKVKDRWGQWVGCECVFTIVYDVMVVCTSIYQRGMKSDKRAMEAPIVRRTFTSSPRDPRYHMLSHMSAKFAQPAKAQYHEPRAALFLNRFTRTLTIMYATSGIQEILGIPSASMRGRSFYYCIAENCLPDAVKCLENAKGNDSVAYLRFWFRDPRQDDPPPAENDSDEEMSNVDEMMTDSSADNGYASEALQSTSSVSHPSESPTLGRDPAAMDVDDEVKAESRTSSGESTVDTHEAIFGESLQAESSASSLAPSPDGERRDPHDPVELEAVISCASDGLVVCLRKARPMIPHPTHRPSKPVYANGLFAAPWGTEPMVPPIEHRPGAGFGTTFAPSLGPHGARHNNLSATRATGGQLDQSDFMNAIRDQAIFAWGIGGINGSLADFSKGKPYGEAMPQEGLPIWAADPRYSPSRSGSGSSNGWNSGGGGSASSSRSPENSGSSGSGSGSRSRSRGSPMGGHPHGSGHSHGPYEGARPGPNAFGANGNYYPSR